MMKKERAIHLVKELLILARNTKFERGYVQCSDYDYFILSSGITNKELNELGLPEASESWEEAAGNY